MGKKRDLNLDLIRSVAVAMVVSVHFFLNCGFYEEPLVGGRMVLAAVVRTALMICVPLFLILTGYLRAGRTWSKGYYRGLGRILLTYVLCSLACLAFRAFYLKEALTALDWVRGIFHFSGAPYGWYVEMFIGLYLLSPFLNAMWGALEEKAKTALLLTLFALTFLPTLLNLLQHTRFYIRLLPDWWSDLYPVAYYMIGVALRERPLPLKWPKALALALLSSLAGAALHIREAAGTPLAFAEVTYWNGFFTVITAVLVFSALWQWKVERWSGVLRRGVMKVAELSFAIYLISYIPDQLLSARLREAVGAVPDRLGWLFVLVPLSLLLSTVLAQLVLLVQKGLTNLLPVKK